MPSSRWRTMLGSLFTILVLAICGCSSKDRAISSEEVRALAGSPRPSRRGMLRSNASELRCGPTRTTLR
jgi:hypothetical protein